MHFLLESTCFKLSLLHENVTVQIVHSMFVGKKVKILMHAWTTWGLIYSSKWIIGQAKSSSFKKPEWNLTKSRKMIVYKSYSELSLLFKIRYIWRRLWIFINLLESGKTKIYFTNFLFGYSVDSNFFLW